MVVAELSANHDGDLERAVALVHEAAQAGASVVKLQTYEAGSMTLPSRKAEFLLPPTSSFSRHKTLWDLYSVGATPREWHSAIFDAAAKVEIPIFSTLFSPADIQFLEDLDCPVYKIASPEIGYVQLLDAAADTQKPIIISTGTSTYDDLSHAVERLRSRGVSDLTVLKCTSAYPAPLDQQNLMTMRDIEERWSVRVGFSDHTTSLVSGAAAVALGACVVEKHFSGDLGTGLDGFFSLDSNDFSRYVAGIRDTEALRGSVDYELSSCALDSRRAMRSLYFKHNLPAGKRVDVNDIAIIRPAGGLPPGDLDLVVGCELITPVEEGTPVTRDRLRTTDHK